MIHHDIQKKMNGIINLRCAAQSVGNGTSLSLGFGKIESNVNGKSYREWEVGTYSRNWRIIRNNKVICASLDNVENNEELDLILKGINFGSIKSITQSDVGDVTITFDNLVIIEFICLSTEDDEMFHIFGPNSEYIEFNPCSGWKAGCSDSPWK